MRNINSLMQNDIVLIEETHLFKISIFSLSNIYNYGFMIQSYNDEGCPKNRIS